MAQPNQLNPNVDRISFRAGSAVITGGAGTSNATIAADVGSLAPGSIYISAVGTGTIWVMQTQTWTQLTIS